MTGERGGSSGVSGGHGRRGGAGLPGATPSGLRDGDGPGAWGVTLE